MSDLTLSFIRAIASLSFTLGLVVLVGWVWKNYGQTFIALTPKAKVAPRLNIIESRKLNQYTTLHLIRHDNTEHLIATTSAQTTLISTRNLIKSSKVKS